MKAYCVETQGYDSVIVAAPTASKAKIHCARSLNEARAQRGEMGKILSWIRVFRAPEFDLEAKEFGFIAVIPNERLGVE